VLTKLNYLIDNPWSNSLERAKAAGGVLADVLVNRQLGVRPVSLIGFSLGARVIFYALLELAKAKAFGVIQDVYLMGATVTAPVKAWNQVRSVVSGKFVNAYATNDWLLAYLFRASHAGMATVAGLRPVQGVEGIENVDVSDIVVGHMGYRPCMPLLLKHLGFRTTADHFDEPDNMEHDEGVADAEGTDGPSLEEVNSKRGFSFRGRKKAEQVSSPTSASPRGSKDDGDSDLPPRVDEGRSYSIEQREPAEEGPSEPLSSTIEEHVERSIKLAEDDEPTVPGRAGFDFEQIKKELKKAESKPVEERIAEFFPTDDPGADAVSKMPTSPDTAATRPRRGDSVGPSSGSASPIRRVPSASTSVDDVTEDLRRKWSQNFFHTSTTPELRATSVPLSSDDSWNPNPFNRKMSGYFASASATSSAALPSLTFADANGDLDTTIPSSLPLNNGSDYSISFNPFASSTTTTSFGGAHSQCDDSVTTTPQGLHSLPSPGDRAYLHKDGVAFPSESAASFFTPFRAATNPWTEDQPPPPVRARTGTWS
jgi:Protein of unknown function (DUF726)